MWEPLLRFFSFFFRPFGAVLIRKPVKLPVDYAILNRDNREAWLQKTLASVPKGSTILDAGAGEGQYRKFCGHLNYVSQDFGQYDGAGDGKGLQMHSWNNSRLDIISDISAIPRPGGSFDAIMCVEVLEHLPEPLLAFKEFARLLRKGGVLVVTAPFCSLTHFAPYHFSTGFNRYFYEKHLPALGFKITELMPNGNYYQYLAQELKLRVPNDPARERLTKSEKMTVRGALSVLHRLAAGGDESAEILCFGYHVRAVRA